jgi:hypothetical protein
MPYPNTQSLYIFLLLILPDLSKKNQEFENIHLYGHQSVLLATVLMAINESEKLSIRVIMVAKSCFKPYKLNNYIIPYFYTKKALKLKYWAKAQ